MPTRQAVSAWHLRQINLFLDSIPQPKTLAQCVAIEDAFAIRECANRAVLGYYFPHAIRAGYSESLPRIRAYLQDQGMVFYLRPMYKALARTEWSRDIARKLYAENKASYHPITQGIIEQVLAEAAARPPVRDRTVERA